MACAVRYKDERERGAVADGSGSETSSGVSGSGSGSNVGTGSEDEAQRALAIIRERYTDFGPTLACEKLVECHGIRLAKETVRRLMTDAGLKALPNRDF